MGFSAGTEEVGSRFGRHQDGALAQLKHGDPVVGLELVQGSIKVRRAEIDRLADLALGLKTAPLFLQKKQDISRSAFNSRLSPWNIVSLTTPGVERAAERTTGDQRLQLLASGPFFFSGQLEPSAERGSFVAVLPYKILYTVSSHLKDKSYLSDGHRIAALVILPIDSLIDSERKKTNLYECPEAIRIDPNFPRHSAPTLNNLAVPTTSVLMNLRQSSLVF